MKASKSNWIFKKNVFDTFEYLRSLHISNTAFHHFFHFFSFFFLIFKYLNEYINSFYWTPILNKVLIACLEDDIYKMIRTKEVGLEMETFTLSERRFTHMYIIIWDSYMHIMHLCYRSIVVSYIYKIQFICRHTSMCVHTPM